MRWIGSPELEQGKAHYDYQASKTTITTDYQGPYNKCLSDRPQIGATVYGLGEALKVTGVKVTELDGGAGRIDLVLERVDDDTSFSFEPLGEPTYENEWAEVQKAIETHPKCGTLKAGRKKYKDGVEDPEAGKQRTWENWQELITDDYDPVTGGWNLAKYKSLKEAGVDSYVVYQPIIRRTTIHLSRPLDLGAGSGRRQNPPAAANFSRLAAFKWLGGPDRCTKNKRTYTRETEWEGAEEWSTDIYPG